LGLKKIFRELAGLSAIRQRASYKKKPLGLPAATQRMFL
jgi:hypothetical protein